MIDSFWDEKFKAHLLNKDQIQPDDLHFDLALNENRDLWPELNARPTRRAGVLVPLIIRDGVLKTILTRRTEHLPTHAGQIAFPGGGAHEADANVIETALREAHEEIGLDPALVSFIGLGDNYLTGTNYLITPVLGLVDANAEFKIDPNEVAEVFELPFEFLFNLENQHIHSLQRDGIERKFFAIECEGYYVWGVTATIIRSLTYRLMGQPLI